MLAKPIRTFDGEQGKPSVGVGGPDQIEFDLDNLMAALDPAKTFKDGSAGGIGWENTKAEIRAHSHSGEGDAKIPVSGLAFDPATQDELDAVNASLLGTIADEKADMESRFWNDDNAGLAWSDGEGQWKRVLIITGDRIRLMSMAADADPIPLYRFVLPQGGRYQLCLDYEAAATSGGTLTIYAPWCDTFPVEQYSSQTVTVLSSRFPFRGYLWAKPAEVVTISVHLSGHDAYVYPPELRVMGFSNTPIWERVEPS
jgi:hypothetical protein